MAVYAIAQLSIHDRERYQQYVTGFMPILIKYGGRLLWQRWAISEEYQEIATDRIASTDGPILLVHGV